jgi:hypothetical protein
VALQDLVGENKMLRIETKTKLTPEDVINRAVKFFQGHQLKVLDQSPCSASFEGGGGGVNVTANNTNGVTVVEFVSTEWDIQVKDFIESLPKKVSYH